MSDCFYSSILTDCFFRCHINNSWMLLSQVEKKYWTRNYFRLGNLFFTEKWCQFYRFDHFCRSDNELNERTPGEYSLFNLQHLVPRRKNARENQNKNIIREFKNSVKFLRGERTCRNGDGHWGHQKLLGRVQVNEWKDSLIIMYSKQNFASKVNYFSLVAAHFVRMDDDSV